MGRQKGSRCTDETKERMRLAHSGIKNHFYGKKHTTITRKKISRANKGKTAWNKGKKLSEEHIRKLSLRKKEYFNKGRHPHNWIEDESKKRVKHRIRNSKEWEIWRGRIFERDKYTCQECGVSGVYIEPHHIFPVRSIKGKTLFNIKNGIALCRQCHQKTIWKESNYQEKYSKIVAAR